MMSERRLRARLREAMHVRWRPQSGRPQFSIGVGLDYGIVDLFDLRWAKVIPEIDPPCEVNQCERKAKSVVIPMLWTKHPPKNPQRVTGTPTGEPRFVCREHERTDQFERTKRFSSTSPHFS
jgi:hypothetical protein